MSAILNKLRAHLADPEMYAVSLNIMEVHHVMAYIAELEEDLRDARQQLASAPWNQKHRGLLGDPLHGVRLGKTSDK